MSMLLLLLPLLMTKRPAFRLTEVDALGDVNKSATAKLLPDFCVIPSDATDEVSVFRTPFPNTFCALGPIRPKFLRWLHLCIRLGDVRTAQNCRLWIQLHARYISQFLCLKLQVNC